MPGLIENCVRIEEGVTGGNRDSPTHSTHLDHVYVWPFLGSLCSYFLDSYGVLDEWAQMRGV